MHDVISETERHSACRATREITAYQDLGCLSASKYIYTFYLPIPETVVRIFSECEIQGFRFSKYVPYAKDLLKIKKRDEFQADLIVSGFTATVYFAERPENPSKPLRDAFDRRLYNAGYGAVKYLPVPQPQCAHCPVRHLKKCS